MCAYANTWPVYGCGFTYLGYPQKLKCEMFEVTNPWKFFTLKNFPLYGSSVCNHPASVEVCHWACCWIIFGIQSFIMWVTWVMTTFQVLVPTLGGSNKFGEPHRQFLSLCLARVLDWQPLQRSFRGPRVHCTSYKKEHVLVLYTVVKTQTVSTMYMCSSLVQCLSINMTLILYRCPCGQSRGISQSTYSTQADSQVHAGSTGISVSTLAIMIHKT